MCDQSSQKEKKKEKWCVQNSICLQLTSTIYQFVIQQEHFNITIEGL